MRAEEPDQSWWKRAAGSGPSGSGWKLASLAALAGAGIVVASLPWLSTLLGRLHPVVVHFPIALLLVAATVEIAARLRNPASAPRPPDRVALVSLLLGALGAVVATALGFLLAGERDFSGSVAATLAQHRTLGVATTFSAVVAGALAVALRQNPRRSLERGYLAALTAAALCVAGSGHLGASMVFGDDYLWSALPSAEQPGSGAMEAGPYSVGGEPRRVRGDPIDFVQEIQPILRESCWECHGAEEQKGALRLDARHLALHGGRSGRAIVPGKPDKSTLIARVLGRGGERRMPLHADSLDPQQIAALEAWIGQGAAWPDSASALDAVIESHWAYESISRPEPPEVEQTGWVRTSIDSFVLDRLESEEMEPSPEAGRAELIRRLYLDLVGLPPSVEEVDAFVADDSAEAYDDLVKRLLASPHFGEKWARHWLDLARYADSNGYERDLPRTAWRFRDWVIDAFNRDLPFDQFTVEQIAGDMLQDPSESQRVATGFHRNTMVNEEGGVDPDEAWYETLVDRTNTTATTWLGTTVACAQCHDHKYDPISQRDYYALMAFFNGSAYERISPEFSTLPHLEPVLEFLTPIQAKRRSEKRAKLAKLEAVLSETTPALGVAQRGWERETQGALRRWQVLRPKSVRSTGGSTLKLLDDGSILVSGTNPSTDTYVFETRVPIDIVSALRVEALAHESLPAGGPGRYPDGEFVLTGVEAIFEPDEAPMPFATARASGARELHGPATLIFEPSDDGSALKKQFVASVTGWAAPPGIDQRVTLAFAEPVKGVRGRTLVVRLMHERGVVPQLGIGRFRLALSSAENPFETLRIPGDVRRALALPPSRRSPQDRERLAEFYRSVAPELEVQRKRASKLRFALDAEATGALVLAERPSTERPNARLRVRGAFTSPAEKVYSRPPAFLPPLPGDQMPTRLGLARWLIMPENPLTVRVAVNRIWAEILGTGIVATLDDFGSQGERPSHPELLDWLATEFVEQGWSTKKLISVIVRSATYRQSSRVTPELLERDPANRLLARGARYRLPAELIRDVALEASGKLSRTIGGPSVFPYQPKGLWDHPLPHLQQFDWVESKGEDRFRRGIYTFWRRTTLYPQFVTFDAPTREKCTAWRARTNTPLQALTLLNDPGRFEAVRGLAEQMGQLQDASPRERARYGFRRVLSRMPEAESLDTLIFLYESELTHYQQSPMDARRVVGRPGTPSATAELAAWNSVASALLNLDGAVTRQ